MKIHLATDHAGLELKNSIKDYLMNKGNEVTDHGAYEYDALDDYPDFIFPCARAVASDPLSRGIILGGRLSNYRRAPYLFLNCPNFEMVFFGI